VSGKLSFPLDISLRDWPCRPKATSNRAVGMCLGPDECRRKGTTGAARTECTLALRDRW